MALSIAAASCRGTSVSDGVRPGERVSVTSAAASPAAGGGSRVDAVIATVNGEAITRRQVEGRLERLRSRGGAGSANLTFEFVRDLEIDRRLFVMAAEREFTKGDPKAAERLRGILRERAARATNPREADIAPDSRRVDGVYQDYLIRQYIEKKITSVATVTPAEITSYYTEHVNEFARVTSLTIRQVLIREGGRTSDEARELAEAAAGRIGGGEDFAEVAADVSEGPYAGDGGLWPAQAPGGLIPQVEKAALGLTTGEIAGSFHSPLGWHVIKLEAFEGDAPLPFSEVQQQIYALLRRQKERQAQDALLEALKAKAVIRLFDD